MAKQLMTMRPWRARAAAFGIFALVGATGAWFAPGPSRAAEGSNLQKAEIETIVRDYILNNPEVVRDAISELDRRQQIIEARSRQQAVEKSSDKLFNSANQTVIGNPAGDVTLVEFFDYNCGYCKRALDDLAKLVEADTNLRVVLKDFAVLGPGSTEAAQVATAVRQQFKPAKMWEFHRKLLAVRGGVSRAQALAVAKELGADPAKLEKDMQSPETHAALKEIAELADKLNLSGTPSWVVGDEVIIGAVGYSQLKSKIANVRKCGKTAC